MREREGRHFERKSAGMVCPFSPSCFTCPIGDCVESNAYRYNVLESEKCMLAQLEGDAV